MGVVIILRAIPGSGKSFIKSAIQKKWPETVVCSADHFFIKYKFNVKLLSAAHATCQEKFYQAINNNKEIIVCDNTNLTWKDPVRYYAELAIIGDYSIILAEPDTFWFNNPEECFKKTVHGVPLDRLKMMAKRWESSEYIRERIWELDEFTQVFITRGIEETINAIQRSLENKV
jgi:hypothetical protein